MDKKIDGGKTKQNDGQREKEEREIIRNNKMFYYYPIQLLKLFYHYIDIINYSFSK